MPLRFNEQTGMFEEVTENPQINDFAFDGAPIRYNDEVVKFTWDVQDAEKIFINEIEVSATSTSYDYPLTGSGLQNFVLKIETGGIEKTESLQIKVLETPIFNVEQSSDKLRKGKGESCVVKWRIENAEKFKLRDDEDTLPLASERSFTPESTTDYIFEAIGLDGIRTFAHIVHIDVLDEASVRFEVDKVLTLPHVPIKLSWNVLHAEKIELEGYGEVDYRGEKVLECDRETTFTLRVTDAFGTTEYHQHVGQYPLPLIRSILVPTPNIEKKITVETHFEFKHIQVGIDVNTTNIPKYREINADAFIPEVNFHQLLVPLSDPWSDRINRYINTLKNIFSLNKVYSDSRTFEPQASWWAKFKEAKNRLTNRITDKISNIWNS